MKKQILASLILASLTTSAFALPGIEQPPLIELQPVQHESTLAEGGAERLLHSRSLAEDGSQRSKAFRVAADGAERSKTLRVAEGGAERVGRQSA